MCFTGKIITRRGAGKREGRQVFLAKEMERTTRRRGESMSLRLDSVKRYVQFENQIVGLRTKGDEKETKEIWLEVIQRFFTLEC